jgi:hypothetical protein
MPSTAHTSASVCVGRGVFQPLVEIMKPLTIFLLGCFLACAARAETQFTAYMVTKEQPLFVINVDGTASGWIPLGREFHGCRVSAFDPKTEILTVAYAGAEHSLTLKSATVTNRDPNESLRTLKGLPLAYEVARRGDDDTRTILVRYQQALADNDGKGHRDAVEFLRTMVERVAADGAQRVLAQSANEPAGRTGQGFTPSAARQAGR